MLSKMEAPAGATEVTKRIVQARRGGRDSLGRLLDSFRRYLLRVAQQELAPALRAKVDPSDLVQDTFLEAIRDFACFEGTTEKQLLAWLRRILCNNLANLHRYFETTKRQALREINLKRIAADDLWHEAGKQAESPTRQAESDEQALQLEQAMRRLPEHRRQVLVLHTLEERTFVQIADQLGSTADAVRKLCRRAADELAKFLGPQGSR